MVFEKETSGESEMVGRADCIPRPRRSIVRLAGFCAAFAAAALLLFWVRPGASDASIATDPARARAGRAASGVRIGGISVCLPAGWEPLKRGESIEPAQLQAGEIAVLWKRAQPPAKLSLSVRRGYTEIGLGTFSLARREVEHALRRLQGPRGEKRVLERFELVSVSGLPAFRVESTVERGDYRAVQVQWIVSGRDTYVLTLTEADPDSEHLREDLDRIADAVSIEEEPSFAESVPPHACCTCLAVLAIASLGVRSFFARRRAKLPCG